MIPIVFDLDGTLIHSLPYFDVVIGGNSRPTRKPDPEPLLHSYNQLNAKTGIFIGDSEVDAETGARAQAPFGLYTKGYRKGPVDSLPHTFSFDNFADLPDLIAKTAIARS